MTLEHECRQGRRCKTRWREDEKQPWQGGGTERPDTLCQACTDGVFAAIRKLPDDWHRLQAARFDPRIRQPDTGKLHATTSTRPLPIRADILDLQAQIDVELLKWHNRLSGGDPVPSSRAGAAESVRMCGATVASRLGVLIDLPPARTTVWGIKYDGDDTDLYEVLDGVDAVLRLARLHELTDRMLGSDRRRQILSEPCHMCGQRLLSPSEDGELISCLACHQVWDRYAFARLNGVDNEGVEGAA